MLGEIYMAFRLLMTSIIDFSHGSALQVYILGCRICNHEA